MRNMRQARNLPDKPECAIIQRMLEEYYEAVLPPRQEAQVSAHLSWCHTCTAQLAQIRRIAVALEAVPASEPGAELLRAIFASVAELPSPADRRRVFAGWGRLALYAAGLVVVLAALTVLVPTAWEKLAGDKLLAYTSPVIAFGHRVLAGGGSLLGTVWTAIVGAWPAGKALGEACRLALPKVGPMVAAYVFGEMALMAGVVLVWRRLRRRAMQVPFVSLL